jgi:hypothetical protein
MSLHDLTQRFPIQLLTPQDAALPATVAAALPAQDVRVFACEDAYSTRPPFRRTMASAWRIAPTR